MRKIEYAESKFHKLAIKKYVDNGFVTDLFMKEVRNIITNLHNENLYFDKETKESGDGFKYLSFEQYINEQNELLNEQIELYERFALQPDVFRIDADNKVIQIVEVSYTNPISWNKLVDYAYLEEYIYCDAGWTIDLVEYFLHGNRFVLHDTNAVYEMNFCNMCDDNADSHNMLLYLNTYKDKENFHGKYIPKIEIFAKIE